MPARKTPNAASKTPRVEGEMNDVEKAIRLGDAAIGLLKPFCEAAEVDWKGHYKAGGLYNSRRARLTERLLELVRFHMTCRGSLLKNVHETQVLVDSLKNGTSLESPIQCTMGHDFECPFCGERLQIGFDGKGLVVMADPCPHPEGLVTEWELNVASGKIVVTNDLRTWFPSDGDHNINLMLGCHLTTLDYAKVGMAHGFVGNTCPGVYRMPGDRYVIGNFREELWDEDEEEFVPNPKPCPWGEEVAGVCTDLWWFSIVDLEEFQRRVPHYTPDADVEAFLKDRNFHVVDVKPGVYKFRQDQGINRDADEVEFASFEWVRDPEPVRDYLQEEKNKSLSATEVLIEHCLSWPTLYMGMDCLKSHTHAMAIELWESSSREEQTKFLAYASNHIMCVNGGGTEWHENGFPRTTISEEAKRFAEEFGEIPSFEGFRVDWYPISGGYGGLCLGAGIKASYMKSVEAIHLAPSFVRLGLNICVNAIKFGETPRVNYDVYPPAYEIPYAQERMRLFMDCYRGLRKRYPDITLGESFDYFDQWMLGPESELDRYVAEFDFGPTRPPEEKWGSPPKTVKTGEYFEFDSSEMSDREAGFCWLNGHWSSKKDAERYRIDILEDTVSRLGHFQMKHAPHLSLPLKVVGRVIRGTGKDVRSKHLEVTFDYGTEGMTTERWAFREREMPAVRQFDDPEEYAVLVEKYKIRLAKDEARAAKKTK